MNIGYVIGPLMIAASFNFGFTTKVTCQETLMPNRDKYVQKNGIFGSKTLETVRPQFFYFLFYGFFGPISDVGGRKKIKIKFRISTFFHAC